MSSGPFVRSLRSIVGVCSWLGVAASSFAQHSGHSATVPPAESAPATEEHADNSTNTKVAPAAHEHSMAMTSMPMTGMLGDYPMSREASGTSWQPDAAPMHASHSMKGDWMIMAHAWVNGAYSDQRGPRGDSDRFATTMAMGMGMRDWVGGTLGLRVMLSADPLLVGKRGYPLLFQTGETADGVHPLVDRQHPHDLFMELAGSFSRPVGERSSWFVYAGLPGEPALGPPTFMHRFSGADNPEAPLGHHWLDSTHVSFGVVTGGLVCHRFKLDASAFNAREPDEERYDIEIRPLRSESVRLSFNPSENWSLQASRGWLDSPEQLEPGVDVVRTTASAIYHQRSPGLEWQTTLAWGRNEAEGREATDAWLLDTAVELDGAHTLIGRLERVEKDELFEDGDALDGQDFDIVKLSLGYLHRFPLGANARWGVGALVSRHFTPSELDAAYSSDPTSWLVFARIETH